MSKPFGQLRATSGSMLADYFSQCMDLQLERTDNYRLNRIKKNDLWVRISPSSLPVCPILSALDSIDFRVSHKLYVDKGQIPTEEGDGFGTTYMGLGTLRHSIAQEYLGKGGRILGNWKCLAGCKKIYRFCKYRKCACGSDTTYEEISISVWRPVSGYRKKRKVCSVKLDGLYVADDGSLWVIDFKFCTGMRLMSKNSRKNMPQEQYLLQQRAYVSILRSIFKGKPLAKVKGFILLYVAFDEVALRSKTRFLEYREKVTREESDETARDLEKQYGLVTLANEVAVTSFDEYLLTKGSKALTTGRALQLIREKPCRSANHHKERMKTLHGCPLAGADKCFAPPEQFAKVLKREVRKRLKNLED